MKKRAKLTMSSLAFTVLCCCSCLLALVSSLPITSKPLDNSPDHLTWDVGTGGRAKKQKDRSIFIAPQLNGYNGSLCPPYSKVDHNGKCFEVVNINTANILVSKLQSLLGSSAGAPNNNGEDDYDYYESTGPFQVNLPLNINLTVEQPVEPADTFYDTVYSQPSTTTTTEHGYRKQYSTSTTVDQQTTFRTETSKPPMDQTVAESHTDISFLAFESLPNGTLSTQLEVDGNNGTFVQNIILTSTVAAPTTGELGSSTTAAGTSIAPSVGTDSTTAVVSSTTEVFSTTTTETVSPTEVGITTTAASTTDERPTSDGSFITTTLQMANETTDDDLDGLKSELAEESLMLETGASVTTEMPSTDVSDSDTELDVLSVGSTTLDYKQKSTTPIPSAEDPGTTTTKVLIHTIPPTQASPKPVQIVTPIRTKWYSGPTGATPAPFIVASHTQQERTTRATPETTTQVSQVPRATNVPLLILNDTAADKKNRETIHRQEMKEQLRETMDTNNRFVYHHLAAAPPSTTTMTAPATTTFATTQDHNYIDQLKKINQIVAENKQRHQQAAMAGVGAGGGRIRFPSREDDPAPTASSSYNAVRFPGAVSNRITQNVNRIPDIFPKKTPDSTTQRPPFWWLPSGWEVDQTGQKPMLLRFWSRMPLVRDQSLTSTTSTSGSSGSSNSSSRWKPSAGVSGHTSPSSVSPRGNSKSPSENFYKEVSSQDIYKVLNMRQLKHRR